MRRCARRWRTRRVGVDPAGRDPGLGHSRRSGGRACAGARRPAGQRTRDRRLRDRHGRRPAGPLAPKCASSPMRASSSRHPMPRRRRSPCSACDDAAPGRDLGSACPALRDAPCRRAGRRRFSTAACTSRRTATSSASAMRASVAVRSMRSSRLKLGRRLAVRSRRSAARCSSIGAASHRRSRPSTAPRPRSGVPRLGRRPRTANAWRKAVDAVHASLRRACAPGDGLARMVLGRRRDPARRSRASRRPRIDRLRAWLDACRFPPAHDTPPVDLLGLGPGLTPSGDDVLCGALVALHAVGRADALASPRRRRSTKAAPAATSPLSGAFLRAAAEGLGAEPLHATICALLSGQYRGRWLGISRPSAASATPPAGMRSPAPCSSCRHSAQLQVQRAGVASPELSL